MTATESSRLPVGNLTAPPFWVCVLLGIVFILAGFFVLGDVVLVTVISAIVIGIAAIVAGAFEIVHAFWTKGWGGFLWQILLGALYVALGIVLVRQPVAGALILTYVLGLLFLVSGAVRIIVGIGHWKNSGWIMVVSGVFGMLAGLVVLSGFPATGLWVLGFMLGVDLIIHGVAWLTYAWLPAAKTA
ncbi:MAG: HdeD family acid-resistance protein [Pseudomonadota bacterium]